MSTRFKKLWLAKESSEIAIDQKEAILDFNIYNLNLRLEVEHTGTGTPPPRSTSRS